MPRAHPPEFPQRAGHVKNQDPPSRQSPTSSQPFHSLGCECLVEEDRGAGGRQPQRDLGELEPVDPRGAWANDGCDPLVIASDGNQPPHPSRLDTTSIMASRPDLEEGLPVADHPSRASTAERVLRFSQDRSLGLITVKPHAKSLEATGQTLATARLSVLIPAGMDVRLRVDQELPGERRIAMVSRLDSPQTWDALVRASASASRSGPITANTCESAPRVLMKVGAA